MNTLKTAALAPIPERQARNRHQSERRVAAEHAKCVGDVAAENLEPAAHPDIASFLERQGRVAERSPACELRLASGQARLLQLRLTKKTVRLDLFGRSCSTRRRPIQYFKRERNLVIVPTFGRLLRRPIVY